MNSTSLNLVVVPLHQESTTSLFSISRGIYLGGRLQEDPVEFLKIISQDKGVVRVFRLGSWLLKIQSKL